MSLAQHTSQYEYTILITDEIDIKLVKQLEIKLEMNIVFASTRHSVLSTLAEKFGERIIPINIQHDEADTTV